ncbi:MAG: S8 family peptidase [Pseudomonadales bacterium]
MKISRATLIFLLALQASCVASPPIDIGKAGSHFLVTFNQEHFSITPPSGGSTHVYHAGDAWLVPLHLRARIKRLEKKYSVREIDGWPIKSLKLYCVVFEVDNKRDLAQILATLRGDEKIANAQAMNTFNALSNNSYNDPKFNLQYGDYAATVQDLHQHTRGLRVKVGVVDSTVDTRHPDLSGQIKKQHDFVGASNVRDQLHGTAVTGVIGAAANNGVGVVGLAPEASIYIYGACANDGEATRCTSFTLAKALEHAMEDGIDVLNLSLAGPQDALLAELIRAARARGMIIIAAANPQSGQSNFPASMTEVYAVSGNDDNLLATTGSNWFADDERLSTQAGGGYQFFYGSSVAAAGASGLVTLLRAVWPAAQAEELLRALMTSPCGAVTQAVSNDRFLSALQKAAHCDTAEQAASSESAIQQP